MSRSRSLRLAWGIVLVGALAPSLFGGCAPHPEEPEEIEPPSALPGAMLGERSEQVHAPLALTATDGTRLRLVSIRANAVIEQPLAFTELHLVFENLDDRAIEGRFRIELPPRAAISRLAMKIGDVWQEGEVVERQAARVAYEDFLHRRQDPALLEHEAGNTFSARVFPIAPRARKEIIVSFSQELPSSTAPYRLALRGLPELEQFTARIVHREHDDRGIPIALPRTFEVEERRWTPPDDLTIDPAATDGGPIALRNGNLVVARLTPEGVDTPRPLGELTVLFDTSASRALGFDTRIHRLAELVQALVEHRGENFQLRVVAFDQTTAPIYDGRASEFGRDQLEAIAAGRALGASDLVGALTSIAEDAEGTDRIVVVTDGIITAGSTEIADLRIAAARLAEAGVDRIDAVLDGGSHDEFGLRALTTGALPEQGIVVDGDRPVAEIADKLSRTTLPPIQVTVPRASWVWPSTLEGVQIGEEVLVYAELPPDVAMQVQLGDDEAIRPLEIAAERPLLERAWVRANIERLQAQRSALAKDEAGARTELDKRIVALSTEFRVLSELTALLVLETEADYQRFGIRRDALADILAVGMLGVTLLQRTELGIPPPHAQQWSGFSAAVDPQLDGQPGLIGMVQQENGHFLASPYGAAFAVGNDDEDVWGALTGTDIDEAFGIAGLGLVGTGRGGAGSGEGVRSFDGGCAGAGFGCRRARVPVVRQARAVVKGALDKDIIRRIVRAHINEIRGCYNEGLVRNPGLKGRFAVQFTIAPTGRVSIAAVESSTLRDDAVAQCAARAVKRWKFPKPESGDVVVTYPFVLEPGDGPSDTPVRTAEPVRPAPVQSTSPPTPASDEAAPAGKTGSFAQVMVALAEGRTGDALATTLAWRETDAGNVLALVALGEVAEALGDRKTAARAYGSIVDLHPARADLRRYAGARLERLGAVGLELALDTYAKALASRPDHPSSHRAFAYAALKAGRHREAFETLVGALQSSTIRWDRFPSVREILGADLGIVGAAWLAVEPSARTDIEAQLRMHRVGLSRSPSTRFVLSWETDANDVDFHIDDANGGHAFYASRVLPSGGELLADVTTGYGPECFAIEGTPAAGPYKLWAHYFSQGPMGFGMGKLQIVVHDGHGGVQLVDRPFVILESGGRVELGTYTPG